MKLDLAAPHQTYLAADGRKLTGVTTYCGVLDKPPLRPWACGEERRGIMALADGLASFGDGRLDVTALRRSLPVDPKTGKDVYYADVRTQRAADLGTVIHAHCEAFNIGEELEPDGIPADLYEKSVHGFERYKSWLSESGLTVLRAEEQFVWEGTDDDGSPMAFGGTRDVVCADSQGRLVLVDLKSSKASAYWPYDETYAQVAAYAYPEAAGIDRVAVVRVGKEEDDPGQQVWLTPMQREVGWALFCGAYWSYEAKKALARANTAARKGGK